jgi:hypothetical protein
MYLEVLDFLMSYESDLRKRRISIFFSVFIYRFFTGLSLRVRADISKVTAHERIQLLYLLCLAKITSGCGQENYIFLVY